ncbi:transcription factor DYT1-like [Vicia villosa]|uniref:transcription factor DYT1-like n=1 Tax=Vicia villosa TaxID=3911 RepID=UPI00273C9E59|nr:transcription factor DYT1-like [Vicia villosa]
MEQVNDSSRFFVSQDELFSNGEEDISKGKPRKKYYNEDGTRMFVSKNLEIERRRRDKLHSRLCTLRSIMLKESIIEDAITYVKKLQDEVNSLTQELQALEAKENLERKIDEVSGAEEMKKWGMQEEIHVEKTDGTNLWIKMIIEKKRERFNKLMEIMNDLCIEMTDISVTTIKGAYMITTCLKNLGGEPFDVDQAKYWLQDIIKMI